jgi:hypothetical protein
MRTWSFVGSVSATSLGWFVYSFTLMMVYSGSLWTRTYIGAAAGLLLGAFAGAGQYALLHERITRPARWIMWTSLGWSAAALLVILIGMARLLLGLDLGADYRLGLALGGIAVAVMQWMVLNRRPALFLSATAAAWALAGYLSWTFYEGLYRSTFILPLLPPASNDTGFHREVISAIVGASISGLLLGVLASLILVTTLRATRSAQAV